MARTFPAPRAHLHCHYRRHMARAGRGPPCRQTTMRSVVSERKMRVGDEVMVRTGREI